MAYSSLGICFEKQIEKQVGTVKSLKRFNKKYYLKQIESIFTQNLVNELFGAKLKEIVNLQDIIETYELHYKSKCWKV